MPNPKLNIVVVKFMFSNSVKEMFCESYLLNKIVTLFYTVWRGGIRIFISRVLVVILLLCFPNISIKADFEGAWFAYENGNYNVAVREFLRCAEKGNDKCQLYLGDIYRYGHGTVVRKDKALEWYLRSVNQKNSVAAGRLYSLYLHNSVISEDKILFIVSIKPNHKSDNQDEVFRVQNITTFILECMDEILNDLRKLYKISEKTF